MSTLKDKGKLNFYIKEEMICKDILYSQASKTCGLKLET